MDLSLSACRTAMPDAAYVYYWVDSTSELPIVDTDATELRENVIEVLVNIGTLLVRSKFIFLNLQNLSRYLARMRFLCDHCVLRIASIACILLLCSLLMARSIAI